MESSRPDVLTITPNPSLDLLHDTELIAWDDANRVDPPRRRAGGQGINVSRAVVALGGTTHVVTPLGGRTGEELRSVIDGEGIPSTIVAGPGETRIFAALRETSTGRSILINPRGPAYGTVDVDAFKHAAEEAIRTTRPRWVACCGSLPPGFPPGFYASMGAAARSAGASFTTDCDGEALRLAFDEGADLLVPNRFEAERLTGRSIEDVSAAIAAARSLAEGRPGCMVVITMGAEGAVLVSRGFAAHASAPPVDGAAPGAAVGAGDALLAAVLLASIRGIDLRETLAAGVAAGTAVLSSQGAQLIDTQVYRALTGRVTIVEIDE